MNRQNVLIYLNSTGNEALDCKALAIMEEYCNRKGYKIVNSLGEYTDLQGMSPCIHYMTVGMAAKKEIDYVVTISSSMLGNTDNALDILADLEDLGTFVESVADDMDDLYELLYDSSCEETEKDDELSEFFAYMKNLFETGNQ